MTTTLALPLQLVGCNIYDTDGNWIALLHGDKIEYREWGAQIVAAVNTRVDYAPLEIKYADLLAAAKRTIAQYEGIYDEGSQEIYMHELRAAIARAEQV